MTKDVLVTVKGLQYTLDDADDQRIETMNRGTYGFINGKHVVSYEESPDGEGSVKSLMKFDKSFFELTRKGDISVHMLFEEGKKNYTDYRTPFGNLVIGVDTESIDYSETESNIKLSITYDMEMNYEHVAKCTIDVEIDSVNS